MTSFLVFRLRGQMAAFGDIAVGERRPIFSSPGKSGVLGLVAAALGLKRDDPRLPRVEEGYGFACRIDAAGTLLTDFHTAQEMPGTRANKSPPDFSRLDKNVGKGPRDRREELSLSRWDLDTTISHRDYFCDVSSRVALWPAREQSPFTLAELAEALKKPRFTLYLGRKSCPLALPIQPQIVEADDPVAALDAAQFDELPAFNGRADERSESTYRWEGDWAGLRPDQSTVRRDQGHGRAAWQFIERVEHVARQPRKETDHVAEQG